MAQVKELIQQHIGSGPSPEGADPEDGVYPDH